MVREWKLLELKGYIHNAEIAGSLFQKFRRNERRNRLAQVDTVNKDVSLLNCVIRPRLSRLVLSEFQGQHGSICYCQLPKPSFLLLSTIK